MLCVCACVFVLDDGEANDVGREHIVEQIRDDVVCAGASDDEIEEVGFVFVCAMLCIICVCV
jgi:hypothetical protein